MDEFIKDLSRENIVCSAFCNSVKTFIAGCSGLIKREENQLLLYSDVNITLYAREKKYTLNDCLISMIINDIPINYQVMRTFMLKLYPDSSVYIAEFGIENIREEKKRFRALLLVDSYSVIDFESYFSTSDDSTLGMCVCINSTCHFGIRINCHNLSFLIYFYSSSIDKKDYIVIEGLNEISYDNFCKYTREILTVIGFFTGRCYFGPFYLFEMTSHKFLGYNDCMGQSDTMRYVPFLTRRDVYLFGGNEGLNDKIKKITHDNVQRLFVLLDDVLYSELFYLFSLLSKRSFSSSPNIRLISYATCLEMCNRWYLSNKKNKESGVLLTDNLRKTVRGQILEIINNSIPKTYQDECDIIKKKIDCIFQKPNAVKLESAFQSLGLKLSEQEKEAFKNRNHLLHGTNIIKTPFNVVDYNEYITECEKKCFTYHALIWRFIMKSINYSGWYKQIDKVESYFRENLKEYIDESMICEV